MKFIKILITLLVITYLITWAITQNPDPFTYNKMQLILSAMAVLYCIIMSIGFSFDFSKKTPKNKNND